MPSFAIIVPCYNEKKRFKANIFYEFGQTHIDVTLFFVNDGSTDGTHLLLEDVIRNSTGMHFVNLSKNLGKGEAIRQGIIAALNLKPFEYIGYLDADLSTSINEFYEMYSRASQNNIDFIFGSRIQKLGSTIKRSFSRHIIGRGIASIIDKKFELGYYDTQCGAKIFKTTLLQNVTQECFSTKWFFDIELFLRLKAINKEYIGIEYPLKRWNNVKGSKINLLSFPLIAKEIFVLFSKYK